MKQFTYIKYKIKNIINSYFKNLESKIYYNQKKINIEQNILHSKELGISKNKYCDHDIIVSLTTYSKRLHEVHLAIESIMEQTMKANKIILWLQNDLKDVQLPRSLYMLQERGLEIKFCEDIRSYKKLIPTMRLYPQDAIITIDDDVIYNIDFLENLIIPYLSDSRYIYCHRLHRMVLNKENKLLPYNKWNHFINDHKVDIMNFPTGVGGILYPPNSLDKEVFNSQIFMDICKYADDIWFKAMSLKKGTHAKKVFSHNIKGEDFIINNNVQDISLTNINVYGESLNDKQLDAVFTKYNLYSILS